MWGAKDGINPRTLKGHTRAVTALAILGVGKTVLSGSLDGTIRIWEVGTAKEIRRIEMDKRGPVQAMVLVEDQAGLQALGAEGEERVVLAASQTGLEVFKLSGERIGKTEWALGTNLVSFDYSPEMGMIVSGHANGTIALRRITDLEGKVKLVQRNEASVYSVKFDGTDLLVGTAAGLPARLAVNVREEEIEVDVKEEYGGWEAVGVECWAVGEEGGWCAGGEGGIRRY